MASAGKFELSGSRTPSADFWGRVKNRSDGLFWRVPILTPEAVNLSSGRELVSCCGKVQKIDEPDIRRDIRLVGGRQYMRSDGNIPVAALAAFDASAVTPHARDQRGRSDHPSLKCSGRPVGQGSPQHC